MLELTALPSIGADRWVPWVREADVLLADGGDATYLCHWMRQCGLVDILPFLHETVWVGMSAGSMVMTPRIGDEFVAWPDAEDDETLGVVDFSIFRTRTTRTGQTTPWTARAGGRHGSRSRGTRSMTRPRSR